MPIRVNCHCGQSFSVKDKYARLHVRCPKCGIVQTAPGRSDSYVTAAPAEPPPSMKELPVQADSPVPSPVAEVSPAPAPRARLLQGVGTVAVLLAVLGLAGYGVYQVSFKQLLTWRTGPGPGPGFNGDGPAVNVMGTATPGWRTEAGRGTNYRYHQWTVSLNLSNETGAHLMLGNDLFLIESSSLGSAYDGVALFRGWTAELPLSVSSLLKSEADILDGYGLSNYEIGTTTGQLAYRKGNNLGVQPSPGDGRATPGMTNFGRGSLTPGAVWSLQVTAEQGTMLQEDLRRVLRVVLPEMRLMTAQGEERYRLVVSFPILSGEDQPQESDGHEWIKINPDELSRLIESTSADSPTRALAANWLAALDEEAARGALQRSVPQLRHAKLLISYFKLLTRLRGNGLEARALKLCLDPGTPSDVRRLAAEYLGAMRDEPALKVLAAAAADTDDTVARGAITGLGASRSPAAVEALLALLKDGQQRPRHLLIAQSLARSRVPEAVRALEELAGNDHLAALYALAESPAPQSFAFFQELAGKETNPHRRDLALRGLRCCDGERAGPVLLRLLGTEEPPPADQPLQGCAVVQELIALSSAKLVPELSGLAAKGNLRALQVLAGYRDESALAPLRDRARHAAPPARTIALHGLARHWPRQSAAVFKEALASDEPDCVILAGQGLAASQDPAAPALLLATLNHPDRRVRHGVAASLASLPAQRAAPLWLQGLLATDDDQEALILVDALIGAQWKERAALARLGDKLKAGEGDMRFQIIRLLRHLAGEAMGPATYFDYQREPDTWSRQWSDWVAKQQPAR